MSRKRKIICAILAVALIGGGVLFSQIKEKKAEEKTVQSVAEDTEKEKKKEVKEKVVKKSEKDEKHLQDSLWIREYDGGQENYEFNSDGTCKINGAEGEYAIYGNKIKLVIDGITLDYDFENKGKTIVINGLEYRGVKYTDMET